MEAEFCLIGVGGASDGGARRDGAQTRRRLPLHERANLAPKASRSADAGATRPSREKARTARRCRPRDPSEGESLLEGDRLKIWHVD